MSVTAVNQMTTGVVLEVSEMPTSTSMSLAASAGATTLYVDDVNDFNPTGGQLQINGVTYSYSATDDDLSSITLSSGLVATVDENFPVILLPLSLEKWALVQIDPQDDAVRARIPHSLADKFIEGIREETERESVLVYVERTAWTVYDIVALAPAIDGQYLMDNSVDQSKVTFDAATLGADQIFVQSATPTTQNVDDVWVDTGNGNIMKRWDGTTWQLIDDSRIAQALTLADAAATIYRQSTAPASGMATNDLWIDSDDGKVYVWAGSWILSDDQRIATVVASNATKISLFSQISAPSSSGRTIGDIWIDTDDGNRLYDWNGTAWTARPLGASGISATAMDLGGAPSIVTSGTDKTFYNVLAAIVANTTNVAGLIVIKTPITYSQKMFSIRVKGYNYLAGSSDIDLTMTGYAYTTPQVLNSGQSNVGSMPVSARYGRHSDGSLVIILKSEVAGNLWQYPRITIPEAHIGFTLPPDTWLSGWSTSVVADETALAAAYTLIQSPPIYDAGAAAASANSLATLAKNTADSKITVYRQSTAPTGGTYKVNADLWIDSDDGMVYYTSTTTGNWIATPDQRIAAVVTSNATKTTVFAQISAPSTTGRTIGDIWIDTDDGNKVYDWSGAWTPRTFGASAISATARQLGSITTYYQTSQPASGMLAGDLWIDTDDSNKVYRYSGSAWQVAQDQGIAAAISAAAGAQATADGKVKLYAQTSAPTGLLATDDGDLWVDTDDSNKLYRFNGGTLAWVLIQDAAGALAQANTALTTANGKNTVTWSNSSPGLSPNQPGDIWFVMGLSGGVIAQYQGTGGVSWASQPIRDEVITSLTVGKLTTGSLQAGVEVIAGPTTAAHARLKSDGFHAYSVNPDGNVYESTRLGTGSEDALALSDASGNVFAGIDSSGAGKLRGGSVDATSFGSAGQPTGGFEVYGTEFLQWLNSRPKGVIAYGYELSFGSFTTLDLAEKLVMWLDTTLESGRLYKIHAKGLAAGSTNATTSTRMLFRIRLATDGNPVTESSLQVRSHRTPPLYSASGAYPFEMIHHYALGSLDGSTFPLSVGVTLQAESAGRLVPIAGLTDSWEMAVEDVGVYQGNISNNNWVISRPTGVKKFVSVWDASSSEAFDGSGVARTDTTDIIQGYLSALRGDHHSHILFNNANSTGDEANVAVATALTGATLIKAEVYLSNKYWAGNTGSTIVRTSTATTLQSTTPTGTAVTSTNWAELAGRWVDITSIFTTASRSILIGKSGLTDSSLYGRFNFEGAPVGYKPRLRLTYTR